MDFCNTTLDVGIDTTWLPLLWFFLILHHIRVPCSVPIENVRQVQVCTYLCLGLFSNEYHIPGCVVYRYIGQIDPVSDKLIQLLHGRGSHEKDGTRLWEVNHLTYQMHTL